LKYPINDETSSTTTTTNKNNLKLDVLKTRLKLNPNSIYLEHINPEQFTTSSTSSSSTTSTSTSTTTTTTSTNAAQKSTTSTVLSIRQKLGKGSKKQKDPAIMNTLPTPVFISHRVGSGLEPEKVKKSQSEHQRKLLGLKYHMVTKGMDEKTLQAKRRYHPY